jgi:hypothetical protein
VPKDEPATSKVRVPTASWILGGVSILGLVGFTGFGLTGKSAEGCVPSCTRSQVDDFRRDYLFADLSLGVAIVTGGLAAYFALTTKPAPTNAASR